MNIYPEISLKQINAFSSLYNISYFNIAERVINYMQHILEMKNEKEYCDFLIDAQLGMETLGNSFLKALSNALSKADVFNQAKIVITFYDDLKHHADLYKKFNGKKTNET